jgi:hypothetical protein
VADRLAILTSSESFIRTLSFLLCSDRSPFRIISPQFHVFSEYLFPFPFFVFVFAFVLLSSRRVGIVARSTLIERGRRS